MKESSPDLSDVARQQDFGERWARIVAQSTRACIGLVRFPVSAPPGELATRGATPTQRVPADPGGSGRQNWNLSHCLTRRLESDGRTPREFDPKRQIRR